MESEALLMERQHYEGRVSDLEKEIEQIDDELQFTLIRLDILNDVNQRLEPSNAKSIIEHDKGVLEDNITELSQDLRRKRVDLVAFKEIVDELYNI